MRATVLLLATTVLAAGHPGDPGSPEYARATGLVKKLGDSRFTSQEAAAKELVEMGTAALAALREGQKSADEEVRTRCTNLIPKAVARHWDRRADAFLAD